MRQPRYRATIRAGHIDELPSRQLHGIYGHFRVLWEGQGQLTRRQEWLWEQVQLELGRRWLTTAPLDRCHCEFCMIAVRQFGVYPDDSEVEEHATDV